MPAISPTTSAGFPYPDGTVLFATEPAAQVYDPVSAAFSVRGTMFVTWIGGNFAPDYIEGQTATLLLNG
jgi:hypothetical protein